MAGQRPIPVYALDATTPLEAFEKAELGWRVFCRKFSKPYPKIYGKVSYEGDDGYTRFDFYYYRHRVLTVVSAEKDWKVDWTYTTWEAYGKPEELLAGKREVGGLKLVFQGERLAKYEAEGKTYMPELEGVASWSVYGIPVLGKSYSLAISERSVLVGARIDAKKEGLALREM